MKLKLEQGSLEWTVWRDEGIGASEASIIMGSNPWKSPYKLWLEKTGRLVPDKPNAAMRMGTLLEPEARAAYVRATGMPVYPACFEHDEHRFVHASVDGISVDDRVAVEIKCPGHKTHEIALRGEVPEYYYAQCQQIMLVTGAEYVDYYSYYDGSGVIVKVLPNELYQSRLLKRLIEFWDFIKTETPPPLGVDDYKVIDDDEFLDLESELSRLKNRYEQAKEAYDDKRQEVLGSLEHPSVGNIFRYSQTRSGSVDWNRLRFEHPDIDFESYKKYKLSWRINLLKNEKDE